MPRSAWRAKPPTYQLPVLPHPADTVVITHTASIQRPDTMDEYCHQMQLIQELNFDTGRMELNV